MPGSLTDRSPYAERSGTLLDGTVLLSVFNLRGNQVERIITLARQQLAKLATTPIPGETYGHQVECERHELEALIRLLQNPER